MCVCLLLLYLIHNAHHPKKFAGPGLGLGLCVSSAKSEPLLLGYRYGFQPSENHNTSSISQINSYEKTGDRRKIENQVFAVAQRKPRSKLSHFDTAESSGQQSQNPFQSAIVRSHYIFLLRDLRKLSCVFICPVPLFC
jgi:hypothetical protein